MKETIYSLGEYKNNSEARIPNGAYRAAFSKRISAILGSFPGFLNRWGIPATDDEPSTIIIPETNTVPWLLNLKQAVA